MLAVSEERGSKQKAQLYGPVPGREHTALLSLVAWIQTLPCVMHAMSVLGLSLSSGNISSLLQNAAI